MVPLSTKPHYDVLDGLRGVAAMLVIVYHIFECFSTSPAPHGYLAVDFFFVLSGFVIGYAYDGRWQQGLTTGAFIRRRLIRLHPMVVAGALMGAAAFVLQGSVRWDGTSVGTGWVMTALLCAMLMLPAAPGSAVDVRGNGELFPLNGPSWSLFFEYIGNVLYALLLRRLPTWALAALAVLTGSLLLASTVQSGYLGVGWSMAEGGFWLGLTRMLFPYTAGMWMARCFRPLKGVRGSFWWCGMVILAVGCVPALGGEQAPWANGLFDALCVVLVFPPLVWAGASEPPLGARTARICRILGEVSYPLYAIHYPLMYLFYARIGFDGDLVPIEVLAQTWPWALALLVGCPLLAWLFLCFYDRPVRQWLSGR